jgi:hypothetical protein
MSQRHTPISAVQDQELHSDMRIPEPWLWIVWAALLAITILNLIIYAVGIPAYFSWFNSFHTDCLDGCLTPHIVQSLHALGISLPALASYWITVDLLFVLVYFGVAALIVWRKPTDRMALLAAFSLIAYGASFPSIPGALVDIHPSWWLPVNLVSEDVLGFPSLIVFLLLFPNGRFVPRWTRWVAVGAVALLVPEALFPGSSVNPSSWLFVLFLPIPLVVIGAIVFSQIYRYRHVSTPVERQQTKWIVFSTAVALVGFLLIGYLLPAVLRFFIPFQSLDLLPEAILVTSIYLLLLLIPLSIAIAILRYRLWDIDVLISKTLVYVLLTSILLVVYAACIFGLQILFQDLFHQTSEVTIVISTLIIAALFQPLRTRIQSGINRRFFRRKYDAARTLTTFSTSLREEMDLDQLSKQLVNVVQETMQPSHVSLWLRKPQTEQKAREL